MPATASTYHREVVRPQTLHTLWTMAREHRVEQISQMALAKGRAEYQPLDLKVEYLVVGTHTAYEARVLKARHRFEKASFDGSYPQTREKPHQLVISAHGGTVNIDMQTGRGTAHLYGGQPREIILLEPNSRNALDWAVMGHSSRAMREVVNDAQLGRAMRSVFDEATITGLLKAAGYTSSLTPPSV